VDADGLAAKVDESSDTADAPQNLLVISQGTENAELVFSATGNNKGRELYRVGNTGVERIADIRSGTGSSVDSNPALFQGPPVPQV